MEDTILPLPPFHNTRKFKLNKCKNAHLSIDFSRGKIKFTPMNFKLPSSIALELVPHSLQGIVDEACSNIAANSFLSSINVPEIRSLPIKSYEPTIELLRNKVRTTPHFRMIDRTSTDLLNKLEALIELGLKEVLLIGGDSPKDNPDFCPSGLTTLHAVRSVKTQFPGLKVYTGLDPFRSSFREELDYAFRKIDAGSDGFYTQPFFSVGMLELWLEQLPKTEVWYGIAPVYSQKSRQYWERVNKVVFPPDFSYEKNANAELARQLLDKIAEAKQRAYLMPIAVSAKEYLNSIFE